MDKALADLIKISNITGKNPALVQGGGGNTSVKTSDGKYMYIKASGTALRDMNAKKGWRRLRIDSVLAILKDKSLAAFDTHPRETEVVRRLAGACDDYVTDGSRPSVEAHLHAFLDKCVIHLHPSAVGAYVNAKNGKAEIEKLFADEKLPPLWVPYTDPGFMLAKKIDALITDYKNCYGQKPAVLILEKHGLLVSANTSDAALRLVHKVVARCNSKLIALKPKKSKPADLAVINNTKFCIRKAFFDSTALYTQVSFFSGGTIEAFCRRSGAAKFLATPALAPDELVYANGPAMWIDKSDPQTITKKLKTKIAQNGKAPLAFLVKDLGLFVAARELLAPTIKDLVQSSIFIRVNAAHLGGNLTLNKRQQDFINKWEAESFRKKLAAGEAAGQLQDRIAVVTGAGSGLGRSIAIGLARAGASVAIADVDTKAAQETVDSIKKELLQISTMPLPCDVTGEKSVNGAFGALLDKWGGLDILVNAAGIAPAGPLVEIPPAKWRKTLDINLTGYFLMAQAAAKIMITQGMGGSIVNVSSKSGLEASKDNTPYNATKAGEIHMARGWALELGQYGIRVNSIAPGNVFEGSKIWNPQYIKVCAKKYGIKPEEVIPYYVNKTALKREIKGQDVADAVIFLCSDRARTVTGQTLVPDSGQVMVR
jgi:NAD(P)-dependent dehydrogenase (short-subunit alcohol dehydrogenase family)/rhamnose utilization protein RhaD (predicted bifunctional aldolase and dehydrogenase)